MIRIRIPAKVNHAYYGTDPSRVAVLLRELRPGHRRHLLPHDHVVRGVDDDRPEAVGGQGGISKEKIWLEKLVNFRLEIPYTEKKIKKLVI